MEGSCLTNTKQLNENELFEMTDVLIKYNRQSSCQYHEHAEKDRVGRTILATFIAALGPLSFGFCMGYSSPALEDLQNADKPNDVQLSSEQGSWFSVSFRLFFLLFNRNAHSEITGYSYNDQQ